MKFHQLKGYIQSIYLVEYPQGLLLLDGCCRADIDELKRFITLELKRPFSDLKLIVVTHMHPDHAGAAHKLRDLIGCKIASAKTTKHWYRGLNGRLLHLTDLLLAGWVAGRLGKPKKNLWYSPHLKPDFELVDGETLPYFAEWTAVSTPGHTDRDISVLHRPSHRMYVADLMVKVKNRFIPPFPVFHPNQYRASLQKVRDMQLDALWLAHGGEVRLSENEYAHLSTVAPRLPQTPWRATKIKAKLWLRSRKA
ncbi:MBL fold metallo-hydrolase [Paraglaciecola sp.]|uniref:MBL fold metallo-hydrolase n=1 Tax=Paraglaciecola sp. TaxID=1920173 RepID=UPI0030F495CA